VARDLLDIPNARSSHIVATPRGGGVAIVFATLAALPVLSSAGALTWSAGVGLLGGGAIVALVGFWDDRWHLLPHWRLLGHFIAAAWLLTWLGGLTRVPGGSIVVDIGWAGHVLLLLYVVWLINLTNFMDGIDGLAAVEVTTVCLSSAGLFALVVPETRAWVFPTVVASATLGFLVWNWPPAKIFMGDAGSGFVGLMLAGLSLQAALATPRLFWSSVILLGAFVVDATVTLVRRIWRRERVYQAHRSHAYQHAARRLHGHRPVTLVVAAINLVWLLPLAVLVARQSIDGLAAVVIAYVPLVAVVLGLHAGKPSDT
jgi:Fuc2NAc and GlcNAc transferase